MRLSTFPAFAAFASGLLLATSNSTIAQTQIGCMSAGDAIVEIPSGKLLKFYGASGTVLGDHISKFIRFDGGPMPGSRSDEYGTCTVIYK